MNEFKFKIWDQKEHKMYEWVDGEPQEELIEHFLESVEMLGLTFFKHPDQKYLLYSGQKDKHEKEYCDGDIVKVNKLTFGSSAPLPEFLIVRYYGGMFQLFRGNESLMGLHLLYIEDGEIVGNIYENPEMLELLNKND
ncbi:putative phage protein (TIGR01671 family) [Paenibacillus sp. 1182]|uniref:YopX family protein n=1 Tax=Paenibacillus sp. 1182 TaxID=2806565 RepID=UPI001AE37D34|nr:YopX family protein [Paenibacillus sp. 1182]MBP1309183.1 putative phage protein (TIGR01671 family) [Paenibacillus sp. 1182]